MQDRSATRLHPSSLAGSQNDGCSRLVRVWVALCHGFQGGAGHAPARYTGFVSLLSYGRIPPTPFLLCAASKPRLGGRIRTYECGLQRPVPYRLATPHLVHHIPALGERQVRLGSVTRCFASMPGLAPPVIRKRSPSLAYLVELPGYLSPTLHRCGDGQGVQIEGVPDSEKMRSVQRSRAACSEDVRITDTINRDHAHGSRVEVESKC